MPEWLGICGSSGRRQCKLVWSSSFSTKAGTYPDQLLPSKRTIWHASVDGGYNFPPALTSRGSSGTGLGMIDQFAGSGLFGSDVQFRVFNPQSEIILIFARTANRINVAHTITQAELDSMNEEGIAQVNAGEYVFDGVAATFDKADINQKLSPEEIQEANKAGVSEADQIFRKLCEQDIPNNRYKYVVQNKAGIEYRLDNAGPKSSPIFSMGSGDLNSNSYLDGSSKIVAVDLKTPLKIKGVERVPRAGDTIYLTYIAVKDHYMRDLVLVKWSFQGVSLPPQCIPMGGSWRVARYRFYEWTVKGDKPTDSPVLVSGWRVVETQSMPVSVCTIINGEAADFVANKQSGTVSVQYLPANNLTIGQLRGYVVDPSKLPTYQINISNGKSYHPNAGSQGNPQAYKKSNWYTSSNYGNLDDYNKATRHVFYNVHPKALLKRDVDKFGIERRLSNAIETDIRSGNKTFFPFMDDPKVDIPTNGCYEYLDYTNCKFQPIQPVSLAFFADLRCGTAGGMVYGKSYSSRGDVVSAFFIESPIIGERFAKDTRVLVERHFTNGGTGVRLVAIEGAASPTQSLSCITDPSGIFTFTVFSGADSRLRMHQFENGETISALSDLEFRPDQENIRNHDNDNPKPEDFEDRVGYSGMLGDVPGYSKGKSINFTSMAPVESFVYQTNAPDILKKRLRVDDEYASKFRSLTVTQSNDRVKMSFSNAYAGRMDLTYRLNTDKSVPINILVKSGSGVEEVIDSIQLSPAERNLLRVDFGWSECDSIEIVGDVSRITVWDATVVCLADGVSGDFLPETSSGSKSLANRNLLINTDVMSIAEDYFSRLYVFFNDNDGGISCAQSDDFGISWYYHHGVIQPVKDETCKNPFVISDFGENKAFMFFSFKGKILCRELNFDQFSFKDAMIVERFYKDVLVDGKEKIGFYSEQGRTMRYRSVSHVVAGDLTDQDFLFMTGRDITNGVFDPQEDRKVEVREKGSVVEKDAKVIKYPVAIGPLTAFTNQDIDNIFFSAYRNDVGTLKVFFMGRTEGSDFPLLQCHFSTDDGQSWYDLWEFVDYEYNRLRTDESKSTSYIDRSADGKPPESTAGTNPMSAGQDFPKGINVHWSRLKRHKKEGASSYQDESSFIEIESPYVFYRPFTQDVFLFYVYSECLLCKIFNDAVFREAAGSKDKGFKYVKQMIELSKRAYFVDGNLSNSELQEEIHYWANESTKEIQTQGNIILPISFAKKSFDDSRSVFGQRVCACELPGGQVRVFYKPKQSDLIRSALWNGSEWFPEDLFRAKGKFPPIVFPSFKGYAEVSGGFGPNKF